MNAIIKQKSEVDVSSNIYVNFDILEGKKIIYSNIQTQGHPDIIIDNIKKIMTSLEEAQKSSDILKIGQEIIL